MVLIIIAIQVFVPTVQTNDRELLTQNVKCESVVEQLRITELVVNHNVAVLGKPCNPLMYAWAFLHELGCSGSCGYTCDGEEVTNHIHIRDVYGSRLSKSDGKWMIDTKSPGYAILEYSVNVNNGRKVAKQVVILIDDRKS